ncbi:MAG: hypothetical protein GYA55_02370 [SAR324 cluster bacterium]|uniref:Uncharacterized protein n=1 Tax=SAR324 cluster bacterium TaxID=2024889 RepID=A0A7X9IIF3_9DELT|nr:hypothetical protein [SAR324 cluster bacterium]
MRRNKTSQRGGGSRRGYHQGGRKPRFNRARRSPTQASESGNKRERIAIESGALVLVDQFMLANPQFLQKYEELLDADITDKNSLIKDYGGVVIELEPGTYRIERDPFKYSIIIHPEREEPDLSSLQEDASESHGHVFVDTRCLAMIDRELLDDSDLLEKYQQLWFSGQDKACRDLLRDNGGAVRYGFNRYGDELGVYKIPKESVVCLWPDVAEPVQEVA